jgi:hypothetical protein
MEHEAQSGHDRSWEGDSSALWISAATLDRYLQAIGKQQVYGMQFKLTAGNTQSQEPFDRNLISDTLRRQLEVPPLGEQ